MKNSAPNRYLQRIVVGWPSFASKRYLRYYFEGGFHLPKIIHHPNVSLVTLVTVFSGKFLDNSA